MGCDYYIEKYLEIRYRNDTTITIKLETIRGYYGDLGCGPDDSDYEDTDNVHHWDSEEMTELWNTYTKLILTPKSPILIFKDDLFLRDSYKDKYNNIILYKLEERGEKLADICEIYKCETRRER